MFPSTSRTGFGGTSTFGAPANPFGGSQMFGGNASTFGAPAFGQPSGSVFGAQQTQPQNQLFSTPNISTFGTQPQNAFGTTSIFGQQNPPVSNSLFMGGTSTFGAQNKQTGFAFNAQQPGPFGQTSQAQTSGLFQMPAQSSIFGGTSSGFGMSMQTGTTVKFHPVTGTDSMQKGGSSIPINTKHHSITFMKEYEDKSFEELRLEDYAANRKGPQAGGFGQTAAQPFASTSNTGIFGQTDKSVFGQTNTFGTPAPAFGNTSTNNIFGKSGFGSAITTSSSGFGSFGSVQPQQSTSTLFSNTQQVKPFAQTSIFGTQPQQNTFGTTSIFGLNNTNAQQPSLFGKPAQTSFTPAQTGLPFGTTPASTQSTGLFQTPKPATGFTGFNTATSTTNSGWGAPGGFGTNTFAKPAQSAFGQPTQTAFGTGLQMPQSNLFGGLGSKPAFGTTQQTSLFGNTSLQPTGGFGLPQQAPMQAVTLNASAQLNDLRSMIANSDPYGYSPHLDNLDQFKPSGTHYATNPKDIDRFLKETDLSISATAPKFKKIQVKSPCASDKWKMFETSYDKEEANSSTIGQPINKSIKRLSIRSDPNLKKPDPIYILRDGRLVDKNAESHSPLDTPPKALQLNRSNSEQVTTLFCSQPRASSQDVLQKDSIPIQNSKVADVPFEKGVVRAETPKEDSVNVDLGEEARDQQNTISSADVADTCGVVCTRPQYYILPALEILAQYKNPDGTCIIKGFTIGRHGYGNVHFADPINVANLNIDELVHFRHKQICVYLNDSTKPPVGEGLNRPAQVTLDRVFPSKGQKDEGALDGTRAMDCVIEFEEVLRRACLRAGTTFVDYRPETGSWVFNVPHFSKYELLDSDEAEIRREAMNDRSLLDGATETDVQVPRTSEKEPPETEGKEEVPLKRGLGGFVAEEGQPSDDPHLALEEVDDSDLYTGMGAAAAVVSYKQGGYTEMDTPHWDQDRIPKKNINLMQMKYMFYHEDDMLAHRADKLIEDQMDGVQSVIDLSMSPDTSSHMMAESIEACSRDLSSDSARVFVLKAATRKVPPSESLWELPGLMDATMFKGRSFKCGWGAGLHFYGLISETYVAQIQVSQFLVEQQDADPEEIDPFAGQEHLNKYIDLIYNESTLQLQKDRTGDAVPFFQMPTTPMEHCYQGDEDSLLQRMFDLSEKSAGKYEENNQMMYYHYIWKLILALWGPPPNSINVNQYRRETFNEWLELVTSTIVDAELTDHSGDKANTAKDIFTMLTGHCLDDALTLSSKFGMPQLTLLLAQMNSPIPTVKCDLQQQLHYWKNNGSIQFIDNDILRIYIAVAGMITFGEVNVLKYVDWLRCLAVYFWYIVPSHQEVAKSIQLYEYEFDKCAHIEKPWSKYRTIQETWDILFHIMKLYCNNQNSLETILSPQTHTADPNDYRMSWLLQQVFISMGVGRATTECQQQTATGFASQLEELHEYKWAIFVLLHLSDPIVRKNHVMSVLDRQLANMEADLLEYLVVTFLLPSSWIHEVKAAQAKLLGMHWQEYKHLCYSNQMFESHALLINELAPILMVNHNYDVLYEILADIEPKCQQITRWRYQGGLLLEFVRFWRILQGFYEKREFPESDVHTLQIKLNQMLAYLRSYVASDFKQAMIVAEMSIFCVRFYTTLAQNMGITEQDAFEFTNLFNFVVMPDDYKYTELNKFSGFSRLL